MARPTTGSMTARTEQQQRIEKLVHDVVCEQFSPEAISDVFVKSDVDHEGDPVLRVIVVLAVNGGRALDPRKMVGLVGHLRSRLEDVQVDDFPMVTYVAKREARQLLEAF